MLTVKEVYEAVNGFAPFASQESWDNSGLLVGSMTQPADRILTTLDISEEVIAQAVQQQVQLIVAHHPVIFSPLKALPQNSPVYQLAAHGIAAICVHTPLDMSPVGLNAYAHGLLAEPLALENAQSVLEPSWTDGRGFGHGRRRRWHRCWKRHSARCGIPPRKRPSGRSPIVPVRRRRCWNWRWQRAAMRLSPETSSTTGGMRQSSKTSPCLTAVTTAQSALRQRSWRSGSGTHSRRHR